MELGIFGSLGRIQTPNRVTTILLNYDVLAAKELVKLNSILDPVTYDDQLGIHLTKT